ncbi:TetR/AcrR family transcriptional regulator [Cupriavidus alkaliphilus]|uniref:TetR/AcrR family transcriptional regulator n=1 Tax=Cupriavidus alkaliphilus TaxID=942866 RepID=UPI001FCA487B|nr:TetR/AcrR family transcriptional regulator [Cupriavidus alkaliphilus]
MSAVNDQGCGSSAKRRARRKQARPQELVSAAVDLFVARGYSATRLEDVASAAGVSKGTVYLYFASKEELFKAVVQQNLLPALAEGEAFIDAFEGTTEALLRQILMRWWELVGDSPSSGLIKLLIAESGNFPDLARYYNVEVIERCDRLIARILARGVAQGEFREADVDLTTLALTAPMLFQMMWKHSFGPCANKVLEPKAFLTHVVALLLHGLLRNPATGTVLPVLPLFTAQRWETVTVFGDGQKVVEDMDKVTA